MTKYFAKWWVDSSRLPATLQENTEARVKMLEAVKADLSAGKMTDWGQFANGMAGYCIGEGSEEDVYALVYKYMPVIQFKVLPVLSADQSLNIIKKVAAAMQGK
jgi:hypothetical protein